MAGEPPDPKMLQIPGGPPPGEPIPTTPIEGVDLDRFCAISVDLSVKGADRAAILGRAGLDEIAWTFIEKDWMLRIATALLRREMELPTRYEETLAAARAKKAGR